MVAYCVFIGNLLGYNGRWVIKMEWFNNSLPPKLQHFYLDKNPKTAFYLFLSACIIATVILGYLMYLGWMCLHAGLGAKIFGTVLTIWVLFLGYWGALVTYYGDKHQAHKIKWENGRIYIWNKYMKKVLVYSFEDIDEILFSRNGYPLRDYHGKDPTEIALMLKCRMPLVPIRTQENILLNMEIGLKLKEDWEKWKKEEEILK